MHAVSYTHFCDTLTLMYPVANAMLDEQCEIAKKEMKSKAATELGSFQNTVTNADGAWMTRGHHSQNFTYT